MANNLFLMYFFIKNHVRSKIMKSHEDPPLARVYYYYGVTTKGRGWGQ